MPFSLKNIGVTYQHLMDKVFIENVDVYVDDMLIKSRSEATLLCDVEETLQTLAQAQMKRNPINCTFGVEEGQFLGYQITKEGIQPNQVKLHKFIDSRVLHSIKGVKEINGRLTALGRFVAKSTEKALLLFQTLKGCVDKNHFKWTMEADAAL